MTDLGIAPASGAPTSGRHGAIVNEAAGVSAGRPPMTARALRGTIGLVIAVVIGAAGSPPVGAQAEWENVTGNLAYKLSECGTLTLLSTVPGSDAIIAGVALRGLWTNTSGETWTQIGTGTGSVRIQNRASWITYDPTDPKIFWQSGIYGEVGVYHTTDGGKTFRKLGNARHNDYVSVDFADPERRTLLAGSHEQGQMVFLSVDGGKEWKNVGDRLPPNYGPSTHPFISAAGTFLVNTQGPAGRGGGIFQSTDGGFTWEQVSAHGPMAPPLISSSGIIYWAANGYLVRSIDSGLTWTAAGSGLRPIQPVELPDQRIVAVGDDTLLLSADRGTTWTPLGPALPYRPDGVIYSAARKAFFIWHGDCRDQVPGDAVMKLEFEVAMPPPAAPSTP